MTGLIGNAVTSYGQCQPIVFFASSKVCVHFNRLATYWMVAVVAICEALELMGLWKPISMKGHRFDTVAIHNVCGLIQSCQNLGYKIPANHLFSQSKQFEVRHC